MFKKSQKYDETSKLKSKNGKNKHKENKNIKK